MGLSSAMTTALTGLSAAETQIDVAGNNLANSQTVGFKASDVIFANQFLRTLSQGSSPTQNNGGTNPRQIGLGVQVSEIAPDFSQGTIEISSSPSDLAIQGDGFFIVEGQQNEQLYTRNGIFKTNAQNELVSSTGNRLLGYGVDEFYTLQETQLVPLTIPLGSAVAAQATQNVYLNGNLTPTGDVATTAEVIESDILGDASFETPDVSGTTLSGLPPSGGMSLNGNYSYLITFSGPGVEETRPSQLLGPQALVDGRFLLSDLPVPTSATYDTINIYRNLSSNPNDFFRVGGVPSSTAPPIDYIDGRSDADISDPVIPGYQDLDMDGPKISNATRLVDIVQRNGLEYENLFQEGELAYTGRKGGNILTEKMFTIDDTTTVADYLRFLEQASGIQNSTTGATDPIPPSINNIPGETGTLTAGGVVTADGRLRMVSNNGTGSALTIPTSAFQLALTDGTTASPNLGFSSLQDAAGQSAASNFIVYDTLGIPLNVRLTTVLESRDGQTSTYRWFADSGDNDPAGPDHAIAVGTGLISFDGEGNMIQVSNSTVNIGRNDIPSSNPLDFDFDFSQVSGFATEQSEIAASRQDGSAVGTLTSFAVGEAGEISGVFSNGVFRTLGQVRLAQFTNSSGLQQVGENMYNVSFNSGLPMEGNPGNSGLGMIVAGALELSNTDTGENLIDLLLASTQYRANSRVISTAQQLLDELLNMRR